jgi:hypothetical protein
VCQLPDEPALPRPRLTHDESRAATLARSPRQERPQGHELTSAARERKRRREAQWPRKKIRRH